VIAAAGPSALWYVSRGTGLTTLIVLTASVVLGILHADRRRPAGAPRMLVESAHRTLSLLVVALLIVAAWPPADDRSLAAKFVNWAVDPADRLPTLPPPYGAGEGDDLEAVNAHDLQTRMYDELYDKGGWTRLRLRLKVAEDPFNAATERQLLVAVGVIAAFVVWRFGTRAG